MISQNRPFGFWCAEGHEFRPFWSVLVNKRWCLFETPRPRDGGSKNMIPEGNNNTNMRDETNERFFARRNIAWCWLINLIIFKGSVTEWRWVLLMFGCCHPTYACMKNGCEDDDDDGIHDYNNTISIFCSQLRRRELDCRTLVRIQTSEQADQFVSNSIKFISSAVSFKTEYLSCMEYLCA